MKQSLLVAALAGALFGAPAAVAQAQSAPVVKLEPFRSAPEFSHFAQSAEASALRNGLIGSWAVSAGLSGGIGLYSVTDDSPKLPETRKNWSPMDVRAKSKRMAAVGVKLSF